MVQLIIKENWWLKEEKKKGKEKTLKFRDNWQKWLDCKDPTYRRPYTSLSIIIQNDNKTIKNSTCMHMCMFLRKFIYIIIYTCIDIERKKENKHKREVYM